MKTWKDDSTVIQSYIIICTLPEGLNGKRFSDLIAPIKNPRKSPILWSKKKNKVNEGEIKDSTTDMIKMQSNSTILTQSPPNNNNK